MPERQPLAAKVWGPFYRTWWPPDGPRFGKRAKRRSAKRERWKAREEIRNDASTTDTTFRA